MDSAELDNLIEELETKVERLRALYEQFFMGIEKIPPQVVQKDVDRRLYVLRREQIRNTAKRFKLQTIIQRYNTFQQYWMRISREIENGTYRRHVLRAERTVGVTNLFTQAERKRLGLPEPTSTSSPPLAPSLEDTGEASNPAIEPRPQASSNALPDRQLGHERERVGAVTHELDLDDDLDDLDLKGHIELGRELDDPLLSSMPPPMRKRKPTVKPAARRSGRPQGPTSVSERATAGPGTSTSSSSLRNRTPARSLRPASIVSPGMPSSTAPKPAGLRLPATSAVAGRGLPPLPKSGVPRGAPPRVLPSPIVDIDDRAAKPPQASLSAPRTRPPAPRREAERPLRATSPQPDVERGSAIPAAENRPSAFKSEDSALSTRDGREKPPLPPHRAGSPDLQSPQRHDAKPPSGALDRNRIEQLATKLREARIQTNEKGAVSVDALAKKLENTTDELLKKHTGRRIDFDVVIKDGKAIVKPIVR
ncbi:MAG TPA: MXAN_5187 C-terminal domain-containing protein [Polyangiaceae bacterium]